MSEPKQGPELTPPASPAPVALPKTDQYAARGTIPNTLFAVAVIAAVLGAVAGGSLALAGRRIWDAVGGEWARPQLGLYLAAMAVFHLMEFFTTAGWNAQKLSVDAFLLNNGKMYHLAHAVGLAEYLISSLVWPSKFNSWYCSLPWLGVVTILMITSQIIRSGAMIQAAQSFSHIVKSKKHDDHILVQHGLYSWSRHPSYAGFFYWAVTTQLLLGNVVATVGFVVVLNKFFSDRIADEERWLCRFFPEYPAYRQRVGTKLPFYFAK
ncbi:protein-S-isoprenylcysteine O-methyltransferase [Cryptococcus wingfieldii CBS 7118]|uniref:Protein-S-isoprenylcysteine O-methyltransferase n=1 Tax=Cryptococcus wingfieldii CBS 7118 TaxID=1295528 RepID=A0A1E3J9P5_9TREE|nr:protein-S-isoprenylcysteine O-methyltransferase [Cryptococcus wingfieldii CBS 7118]ODN97395.1 protein-S-isoprenylcysteine O-methyltransferase [Cryptococcus wingfieldii CBS 7118]